MDWLQTAGPEDTQTTRLRVLLEPLVTSEGLVLVELLFRSGRSGGILRLVIDRPDGGVTIDELSEVSRQASDLLDVEDPIPGRYQLEVSSPGADRKFKSVREFDIFAGRLVSLWVQAPDQLGRQVVGRLMGRQGDDVLMECDGHTRAVPLEQIIKARLEIAQ